MSAGRFTASAVAPVWSGVGVNGTTGTRVRRCRSKSIYGDCAKAAKHDGLHEVAIGSGGGFVYGRGVRPGYVFGDESKWEASWTEAKTKP